MTNSCNLNEFLNDSFPIRSSVINTNSNIQPYFGNIKEELIKIIDNEINIVGCIAWITDREILAALQKNRVKIIINKEFYFSTKCDTTNYYQSLRDSYQSLTELNIPNIIDGALLVYGNGGKARMHSKFLVFLDVNMKPCKVWTGSYNFTNGSFQSIENAVLINDAEIAKHYYDEFLLIAHYALPFDD